MNPWLGADVTIIDSKVTGCRGNHRNIAPVAGKVQVVKVDIGDSASIGDAIQNIDTIFNLAGDGSFLMECVNRLPSRLTYGEEKYVFGSFRGELDGNLVFDARDPVPGGTLEKRLNTSAYAVGTGTTNWGAVPADAVMIGNARGRSPHSCSEAAAESS